MKFCTAPGKWAIYTTVNSLHLAYISSFLPMTKMVQVHEMIVDGLILDNINSSSKCKHPPQDNVFLAFYVDFKLSSCLRYQRQRFMFHQKYKAR